MTIERDESRETDSRPNTHSHRITVVYSCEDGHNRAITLALTHLPAFFFWRWRRDEVWGPEPGDVIILRNSEDWERMESSIEREDDESVVLSGPEPVHEPASSGDCFCFEDDMGRRYCVCRM